MISESDLTAFLLTLKLAGLSTIVLLVICTPLSWWLARSKNKYKVIVDAVIALPLVLPPTVLGFYLLIAFAPSGFLGSTFKSLGLGSLSFSFNGLVIGSIIYSMPFVVQPLQQAFSSIRTGTLEAAQTLGAGSIDRFFHVVLPMARPGYLTAGVLGFAHTLGEFGVVLMIGGNIPGETQVLSIAIYNHVESLRYEQAHWLAGSLLLISFILLLFVYSANRRVRVLSS